MHQDLQTQNFWCATAISAPREDRTVEYGAISDERRSGRQDRREPGGNRAASKARRSRASSDGDNGPVWGLRPMPPNRPRNGSGLASPARRVRFWIVRSEKRRTGSVIDRFVRGGMRLGCGTVGVEGLGTMAVRAGRGCAIGRERRGRSRAPRWRSLAVTDARGTAGVPSCVAAGFGLRFAQVGQAMLGGSVCGVGRGAGRSAGRQVRRRHDDHDGQDTGRIARNGRVGAGPERQGERSLFGRRVDKRR